MGGLTYFNVHTGSAPGGLIRAQLFANGAFVAAPGTASGTAGIAGIENALGGSGADSLVGDAAINTLRVTLVTIPSSALRPTISWMVVTITIRLLGAMVMEPM